MDLALDNLQRLKWHKTQTNKPNCKNIENKNIETNSLTTAMSVVAAC